MNSRREGGPRFVFANKVEGWGWGWGWGGGRGWRRRASSEIKPSVPRPPLQPVNEALLTICNGQGSGFIGCHGDPQP